MNLNTLECKDEAYVLINNDNIDYKTTPYTKNHYNLKRGWNYLAGHKDGINIEKTFKNAIGVEFVYVYEKYTQVWAGYSPQSHLQNMINDSRLLQLKKIEPNVGFYVYATKSMKVDIKSVEISPSCMKYINDENYETIVDSGMTNTYTYNKSKSVGIKSRYLSHYRRGVYDESRILLIYPKLKLEAKNILKYGPAEPKSEIIYQKEQENKKFFIYDFKDEKCYMGIFPSRKLPPFSSLKELK